MGLIINQTINMLMKGYPTVSDKYNVSGATLIGNTPVEFGDLVRLSDTKGYFEAIPANYVTADTISKLGGFVLATNVKLTTTFPGNIVQTLPGEAFNLLVNGFMAIELASTAVANDVLPNAAVCVTANGKITTLTDANAVKDNATVLTLPRVVFTGIIENHGTSENPRYLAEIYVK